MLALPTCIEKLVSSTPSVLRTYSSKMSFSNAPMLNRIGDSDQNPLNDGGLKLYVGCKTVKVQVAAGAKTGPEEHSQFVIRVARLENWEKQLETLLDLACQENVLLVTTDDQHTAIVAQQAKRERARAAKGAGDNSKKSKKSKKRSSKPRVAGINVSRVTGYDEVLVSMLNEAEDGAVIYVDREVIGDAATIARFVALRFDRLVIVSDGYQNEQGPGTITWYMEALGDKGRYTGEVVEAEVSQGQIDLASSPWKTVVLVVDRYGDVAGCIEHCRRLVKWNGMQSWQTIVVGNDSDQKTGVRASLVVGRSPSIFPANIGGIVAKGDGVSGATPTELRTFADNLVFANVPNLTPSGSRVLGGLGVYYGSAHVSVPVSRNKVSKNEEPMVFVLRVTQLPDWATQIGMLVRLAMQENVMLITDDVQHQAMVEWLGRNPGVARAQTAGVPGSVKGGEQEEGAAAVQETHPIPVRVYDPEAPAGEAHGGEDASVDWSGPVKIMSRVWMYAEVEKASCGDSWRDVDVQRQHVTIKFLLVKKGSDSTKARHHAAEGLKPAGKGESTPKRVFVYILCDKDRNITGEYAYVAKGGFVNTEKLNDAKEVEEKLAEVETEHNPNDPAPVVYILCVHSEDPSGADGSIAEAADKEAQRAREAEEKAGKKAAKKAKADKPAEKANAEKAAKKPNGNKPTATNPPAPTKKIPKKPPTA
jgi:hypothetical protein